jgi:heme/copper-type cytochrome/quinol oxidase subunit 2
MIENSLDVIRVFCVLFCGPVIMVECILSIAFYNKILNGCDKISDAFTNILIYVLIIMGFVSLTVTGFCCYTSYFFAKSVKNNWTYLRNPSIEN